MIITSSSSVCNVSNLRAATPWRWDEERWKERIRVSEWAPTSALTSSASPARDHTALLSCSHWTTEKKEKSGEPARRQAIGTEWNAFAEAETERERDPEWSRKGREERWEEREEVGVLSLVPLTETHYLNPGERERSKVKKRERRLNKHYLVWEDDQSSTHPSTHTHNLVT